MHKDNLEEFNYETTDKCDGCSKHAHGTMLHAHDAMGWATPVLFLCDRCHKPNWYQKIYDRMCNVGKRIKWKYRFYANNTRAERKAHRERAAMMRAKLAAIKARRECPAERGI